MKRLRRANGYLRRGQSGGANEALVYTRRCRFDMGWRGVREALVSATWYRNPVQLPRCGDRLIASDRMGGYEVDRRRCLDFPYRRVLIWPVPLHLCLGAIREDNDAHAYRFDPAQNTKVGRQHEGSAASGLMVCRLMETLQRQSRQNHEYR
jgi:hypothetical protein